MAPKWLLARASATASSIIWATGFRPELRHLAELSTDDLRVVEARLAPELAARVRHVVTETVRTRLAAVEMKEGAS